MMRDTVAVRRTGTRWFHWVLAACILFAGGAIRWRHIDKQSLWLDEYWALYLATGRGDQLFDLPRGIVMDSAPAVSFAGAPAIWHIWTGLGGVTHPPLYYVVLRGWVELFGDSDRVIRLLSSLFSLGGIAIVFELVREIRDARAGLIAAGIMAFASVQIEYSQTTRPYTMLVFFTLLAGKSLFSIQRGGPTPGRLLTLGISTMAMALTHYFSAGAIFGAGVYALLCLTGRSRKAALGAISAGVLLALIVWGPVFWETRSSLEAFPEFSKIPGNRAAWIARAVLDAPTQLLLSIDVKSTILRFVPMAILIYVFPPILARRSPGMMLWWLWICGTVCLLVGIDVLRGTTLTGVIRYFVIVSPAIYIILATLLPGRPLGTLISFSALVCAVIYGIDRSQIGPEPTQDWKALARLTDQFAGPNDVIAFCGSYKAEPNFDYFIMSHYVGAWKLPVIFLTKRPSDSTLRQLAAYPRVWAIGSNTNSETRRLFPGWRSADVHSPGFGDCLWRLLPPRIAP